LILAGALKLGETLARLGDHVLAERDAAGKLLGLAAGEFGGEVGEASQASAECGSVVTNLSG
jgi:hypothetical protein